MTSAQRDAASQAIRARLAALPELQRAATVMAFIPLPDEPEMTPVLADLLSAGKTLYVPRTFVRARRMFPVRLRDLGQLRLGEYGILEPDTEEQGDPAQVEFLIVPGRAFDRAGNRLGRGGGFYDAFMTQRGFRAMRCGVAFACQVLAVTPHTERDAPVHMLVTEQETLRFRTGPDAPPG